MSESFDVLLHAATRSPQLANSYAQHEDSIDAMGSRLIAAPIRAALAKIVFDGPVRRQFDDNQSGSYRLIVSGKPIAVIVREHSRRWLAYAPSQRRRGAPAFGIHPTCAKAEDRVSVMRTSSSIPIARQADTSAFRAIRPDGHPELTRQNLEEFCLA